MFAVHGYDGKNWKALVHYTEEGNARDFFGKAVDSGLYLTVVITKGYGPVVPVIAAHGGPGTVFPHVRDDTTEEEREAQFRLGRVVTHFAMIGRGVYAAGYFEKNTYVHGIFLWDGEGFYPRDMSREAIPQHWR